MTKETTSDNTVIAFAAVAETFLRSDVSNGLPERQTTRDP